MRFLGSHMFGVLLALLAGSEALILQWALLATGREPLGAGGFAAVGLGLVAANVALLFAMRARSRSGIASLIWSRVFMLGSLGALFSGPPLLAAFGVIGLPLLVAGAPGNGALIAGGGAAVALGFGSILWGFLVGQRRVSVEHIDLPLPGLPPALAGLRIAQITDLHIGPQLRRPQLERLVARVNATGADLIVITGDIFDFDPAYIEEGCAGLAGLSAPRGVYAILGNHDVYTGADAVADGLKRHTHIRLLRDEVERIDVDGHDLWLIGIEDPGRAFRQRDMECPALPELAASVPDGAPSVLLMHRPAYFRQVARLGLPAALAGHTHGGQVALPPPAQHHNLSRLMTDWTRGGFKEGGTFMYVNRGLGVAGPPIRLNCTREIALLSLVAR